MLFRAAIGQVTDKIELVFDQATQKRVNAVAEILLRRARLIVRLTAAHAWELALAARL